MKTIFWNRGERRLRAGWRLLIQFILFFALLVLVVMLEGLLENLFGKLPQHPWFGPGDSIFLPFEMLLVTVLSMWLMARWIDRRHFCDFGVRFNPSWWSDLGIGFLLGAISMSLIFFIHLTMGWAVISGTMRTDPAVGAFPVSMVLALISIVCLAAQEELHSRGYQLKNLAEGLNSSRLGSGMASWLAVVIIAIIFGALHYDADAGMISVFALIAAGLLYATAFVISGQLAIPIGFHVAWNFFQGCVFGFPVSGVDMGTSCIALRETGPDLWTGGAFGPETGLLGIGAHLAAILAVLFWVRSRGGRPDVREKILKPSLLASERSIPCNGRN